MIQIKKIRDSNNIDRGKIILSENGDTLNILDMLDTLCNFKSNEYLAIKDNKEFLDVNEYVVKSLITTEQLNELEEKGEITLYAKHK